MSGFVLLTDFPDKYKAFGLGFCSLSLCFLEEETYLTYDNLDEFIEIYGIDSNDDDIEGAFGKTLFSVSRADDQGNVIKCDENVFFDKLKSGSLVLEGYSFEDSDRIIEIFSTLRDKATKELRAIVSRNGCDAHYPMTTQYFFNEEYGIVGCFMGGISYVLNSTPDFKKYPFLIK